METNIHIQLSQKDSTTHANNVTIDHIYFRKMVFIFKAINDGWSVKKNKESYVFSKNHEGNKEIFLDSYLASFIHDNFDIDKLQI